VRFRAALRAHELVVALHVDLFPALLPFKASPFLHHFHFALRAGGVNFHLGIGRAFAAQPFITVPAAVASVTQATRATMKMILGLLNGGGKRFVVGFSVTGLGQALSDIAGFIDQAAAKHSGGAAEPTGRLAAAKRDKFPAPGVIAALAVKLKLEARIGAGLDGVIGKIFTKMDFAHGNVFSNFLIKFGYGNRKFRAKNCILRDREDLIVQNARLSAAFPRETTEFLQLLTGTELAKSWVFIEIIEERGNVKERSADQKSALFYLSRAS
jgi:hypothetical protein